MSLLLIPLHLPQSLGIWVSSPGTWGPLHSILYVGPNFLGLCLFHSFDQTFSLSCTMSSKGFFFLSGMWRSEREMGFWSDRLIFDDTLTEFRLGILWKVHGFWSHIVQTLPVIVFLNLAELWSLNKGIYSLSRTWGAQHILVYLPLFFCNLSLRIL